MQKVEGSSPFSRSSRKPRYWRGFCLPVGPGKGSDSGPGTTRGYQTTELDAPPFVSEGPVPGWARELGCSGLEFGPSPTNSRALPLENRRRPVGRRIDSGSIADDRYVAPCARSGAGDCLVALHSSGIAGARSPGRQADRQLRASRRTKGIVRKGVGGVPRQVPARSRQVVSRVRAH